MLVVLAVGTFLGSLRAGLCNAALVILYLAYFNLWLDHDGQSSLQQQDVARFTLLSVAALVIVLLIGTLRRELAEAVHEAASLQTAHQERKSLEKVIDASHDAVVGMTPEGFITSWNAAAERISGYRAQEVIGRHMTVMATPETQADQADRFAQACRGERSGAYEATRIGKDGLRMELSLYFVPTLAADGTLESITCMARDNTAYKRSQSALRHSEERFRQVADNLPGVLWLANLKWKFLYVSPGYESVYQRPVRDFLENQRSFLEFVHPDDVQSVTATYTNRPSGVAFEEEFRVLLPDGSVNWVRNKAFPVRTADGQLEGMAGLTTNVTESKRVEEALRESEARFRSLVENASDSFLVHDVYGRLVNVNGAACHALGYSREELLRMGVKDIDIDWTVQPPFWGELRMGEVRVVTGIHRRKDGSTFPIEAHVSVVSPEGAPRLLLASVRDITARLRAEELRETHARQQQAISALGLRALRQEAGGWEGLSALFNEAVTVVTQTFGTDLSMVMEHVPGSGEFIFHGCHGWPAEMTGRKLSLPLGTGSLVGYTLQAREPVVVADYRTETRFMVHSLLVEQCVVSAVSVPIFGEDGSVYGTLSVHDRRRRDFTAEDVAFLQLAANILSASITRQRARSDLQHALEEAAAARREAERANLAKSEFLSRMSHELRTPLNAILGFGQLLQMEEDSSEMNKDCSNHVVTAGRHLLSLIDDVLDIARIESGNDHPQLGNVLVPEILRETVELVRPSAFERRIRLDLIPGQPPRGAVRADPRRLKQVLLNLLSNAIKYNVAGGQVIVNWQEGTAGALRLSVRDTGPGLTPEQISRLYSPFERLDAEQRGIQGTGLGLAVSRRLVEAMGGTLGLDSVPGQGCSFWVELPSAELPGAEAPAPAKGEGESSGWHQELVGEGTAILQIEDNPSNQRVVEMLLKNQRPQWRLLTAANARTGMEIARRQRPALILLDLQLPDLPGDEVLVMLREDRDTQGIPVVMLSADATVHSRERLLAAGAAAYVNKPFDVGQLLDLLDTTLGKEPKSAGIGLGAEKRPRRTVRVGPRVGANLGRSRSPRPGSS